MAQSFRRVVTGHTPAGKSVFVSDGPPPRATGALTTVWATDHGMTTLPGSDDPTPAMTTFVSGPGGSRFHIVVIQPAGATPPPQPNQQPVHLPGLSEAMEADAPGFHTTDSVDYDIIMSGRLHLELDDGAEVELGPGDIVVQNGTRHAWRNKGTEPVVMYSVLVGAPRA